MPLINTLFVGKVVHEFPSLASTNSYAIDLLAKTKPAEGTVISASFQTAGRGQIGSSWHSDAGHNLLLSIILYPTFLAVRRQFSLTRAIALAVADTVRHFAPPARVAVKWPNDVYLNERKAAGILIQNSLAGGYLQWSVVGIGLNVNQDDFPTELDSATSLRLTTGENFDLTDVRAQLFAHVEQRYLQLRAGDASLQTDYLTSLYRLGHRGNFQRADGSPFTGVIEGVGEDGHLLVATNRGLESFGLKEIIFQ